MYADQEGFAALPGELRLLSAEAQADKGAAAVAIITAKAKAIIVSGNTAVFAALPWEPGSYVFAMKTWSTMLYRDPTRSEMLRGIAYLRISLPMCASARKRFGLLCL